MLTGVLAVAGCLVAASPAAASPGLTVTPTTTTLVAPNSTQTLAGLSVNGDTSDTLQATLATDHGTLTMPMTGGLTLSYANHWAGDPSITFTGSESDINAALAAAELVAGANAGATARVSLTALVSQPGYVYLAPNQHFYQYVASAGISWTAANSAAAAHSFEGQQGYLATIPNGTVNDFISSKIQGAQNVWIGAESTDTPTAPIARTWAWTGGPLAGQPISYCGNFLGTCNFINNTGLYSHWSPGEPNNYNGVAGSAYSGEWVAVTNWSGGVGLWNDLPPSNTGASGYVVEYGDLVTGSTGFSGVVAAAAGVLIAAAPAAPTTTVATRGDGQVSVTFTAPADNGSPITGYTATAYDGANPVSSGQCSQSPCTITGLTNGTSYTVRVSATNALGTGPQSGSSNTVTPATTPAAPTGLTLTRGNGSATVAFTAPTVDGGSPILNYTVTASPGGATAVCASSPCTIAGLANGTAYTFTVHATNSVGDSVESDPSTQVTPATVPDAPSITSLDRGDGSATVGFDAPATDGGSAVTGYVATVEPGGITVPCAGSPCEIGGLSNGTQYTVAVAATNEVGSSVDSAPATVTPAAAPDAPAALQVTRGDQLAQLSFTAPADNGSAITGYQVSLDGGHSWQPLDTSGSDPITATLAGLTNGTTYAVAVRAVNDVGPGPSAAPQDTTPATVPGPPTDVTVVRAGAGTVAVSFTAPANDGGEPITGYAVTDWQNGLPDRTQQCAASPCQFTGLTDGQPYAFTLHAINAVGGGDESSLMGGETGANLPPAPVVTPATTPDAPTGLAVTSGNGSLGLSFTAPVSDGGDPITGYEASIDGGQSWIPLTTSGTAPLTATLTGLSNGTTYPVLVRAENTVGASDPAGPQGGEPAGVPGAPRQVSVHESGITAVVSWTAPADNGGAAIVGYRVTAAPSGAQCATTGTTCTIAGLPTGKRYTFAVAADNTTAGLADTGVGPAGASAATMISGLPGAPRNVSGKPGDRVLQVRFSAPASDGGTPITGYQISLDGGAHWPIRLGPTARSVTVTGLLDGSTYRIAVRALNWHGAGPADATRVGLRAWFRDPISRARRRHEVPAPNGRVHYYGSPKLTTAASRSHNGALAMPAGQLHGRQLQPGQAALIVPFRFDSIAWTESDRAGVAAIAKSLRYAHSVTCEGYSDYGGKTAHELALSAQRALAVCRQLVRDGAHVRIRTQALGAHDPVVIGGWPADRVANRRVIVMVNS